MEQWWRYLYICVQEDTRTARACHAYCNLCLVSVMKQILVYECLWAKKVDLWTTCGLWPCSWTILDIFFWYFADRASQYIYLNINQLDALNFIMSLFHASTSFEHMCSSSGGQNCVIQHLVSTHIGGRPMHGDVWWYQRLYSTILTSWRWVQ